MPDSKQQAAEHEYPPTTVRWRAVAILTVLYWFGTLDRQIASLLVPAIKADLNLTDSQVSLIPGLAFGVAFMVMSLPVGWLADRISRRLILFVGVMMWSLAAIGSGLSRNFTQLFSARAVVGGSEAAINPTAYSLLSDLFPASRLTLPMSIFTLGGNLGSGMSFILGGVVVGFVTSLGGDITLPLLGRLSGWQAAFVLTGVPGLLLAFLIWTFPHVRRQGSGAVVEQSSFADLGGQYRRHRAFYILHNLAIALIMSFSVGLGAWNSAYLSRQFGWSLADIGFWLGISQISSSMLGLWLHGWAVDRIFGRGRHDAHLIYFGTMCALAFPFGVAAYFVHNAVASILCWSIAYFLIMGFASIGPAALQIATPPRLRGKATAVYMIVLSILGTILGPIIVAAFTDGLFQDESKLGYSMALFAGLTTAGAAFCCWLGRLPMRTAVSVRLMVPAILP